MIKVNGLSQDKRISDLDFQLAQGEVLHIVGPNGCGKSTLLTALSGLTNDVSGSILIDGVNLDSYSLMELAELRAYLAQYARPSFPMTVHQYIALSLPKSVDPQQREETLQYLFQTLSVETLLDKHIDQLSGGQWQRVRLAASALQIWPTINPVSKYWLLDEPTAALDIGQEKYVFQLIEQAKLLGLTVIVANHNINRSLEYADKILLMKEGQIEAFGMTKEVLTAETLSYVFDTHVEHIEHNQRMYFLFS